MPGRGFLTESRRNVTFFWNVIPITTSKPVEVFIVQRIIISYHHEGAVTSTVKLASDMKKETTVILTAMKFLEALLSQTQLCSGVELLHH